VNKLFFFAGYQGTTIRQAPTDQNFVVPTPAMIAGDFTVFASPACNAGRQVTLRAPFANNRIDLALMSKASWVSCGPLRIRAALLNMAFPPEKMITWL
jgi:hypothetical protein